MSVRNCAFPWHWALVDNDGSVHPCGHGSLPVGTLRTHTLEQVWNGPVMQELRACILRGETHRVCQTPSCPFQRAHPSFSERRQPYQVDEDLARRFDEDWYLSAYPGVRSVMADYGIVSGLEHYIRHGREEGKEYRLLPEPAPETSFAARLLRWLGLAPKSPAPAHAWQPHNAILALLEYSRGLTVLRARPVDLTIAVSTVCNLRCAMCPHGMNLVENPSHIPLEMMERAELGLASASRMLIAGVGEPTLAPAFWLLVEKVKSRPGLFLRANTNAYSLTEDKARRLLASGISELSISIDAVKPETYRRIRGAELSRVLDGVRLLVAAKAANPASAVSLNINLTLMRENLAETADFVDLAAELGVGSVVLTQLFGFGDRPDWRVPRGDDYVFVYSEQLVAAVADEVRAQLVEARRRAERRGVSLYLRDNVDSYLK